MTEKNLRGTLIALLLITALAALGAGYSFMKDPSGEELGIPLLYLQHSGFSNYLIPGIVLFVAIGLLGLFTVYAIIRRWKRYPMIILAYGIILTGWISVQMILVRDFNFLHLICLVIGLGLIASMAELTSKN